MTDTVLPTPKVFISYAWSSDQHADWVIDLASRLRSDGIDVKLDKWDLLVGHDAIAFMESMVTDTTVTKVLMICDELYRRKADHRAGGVGKETQVLTREIYEKAVQEKYAAIVIENDRDGKPCLPVFYGGRRYIDFSMAGDQTDAYEELVRWLFDRPKHVKPKLGPPPTFVVDPESSTTGTTSRFLRADQAVRAASAAAPGFIAEFGDAFIAELGERHHDTKSEPIDEAVTAATETMRPALRHLVELIGNIARFSAPGFDRVLTIFEELGNLTSRPRGQRSWTDTDFDPYRIVAYEGFLALTASLIKERRFDLLGEALSYPYLLETSEYSTQPATRSFGVFNQGVVSFELRKQRLSSRKYNLFADDVHERYINGSPRAPHLVEADVVLFLRSIFDGYGIGNENHWWPQMVLYSHRNQALNLFVRSESLRFFEDWAPKVFGSLSVNEFKATVQQLGDVFQGYGFPSPQIRTLTQVDKIGWRS